MAVRVVNAAAASKRRMSSCGTYDAVPVEVLADVAQEVRELEGVAELAGGFDGGIVDRLEDRQHHLADHGRRSVHVPLEVGVGLVRLDGEVHGHRRQEATYTVGVDPERPHGVDHRLEHEVVAVAGLEAVEEAVAEVGQRLGPDVDRHGTALVDDVVGVAAEPVQGVHVVALDLGQDGRGPVVGRPVGLVQHAAVLVGLLERDRAHRTPLIGHRRAGRRVRRPAGPTRAPSGHRPRAGCPIRRRPGPARAW